MSRRDSPRPGFAFREILFLTLAVTLTVAACDAPETTSTDRAPSLPDLLANLSPSARPDVTETMKADLDAPRHPSDGGGRGWRVEPEGAAAVVRAGERHRFDLVYEAGPLGIRVGGSLFLQSSPFWEWDHPQSVEPSGPGYTTAETDASGVELRLETFGQQLLGIQIAGRDLREGEQIRVVFGAGELGARVDRYAEREERIWFAVDGDGDGVRAIVADSPQLDIAGREPARLFTILPSTLRLGETGRLTFSVLDAAGNNEIDVSGHISLEVPEGVSAPDRISLDPEHQGVRSIEIRATREGIHRISARLETDSQLLESESNPMIVQGSVSREPDAAPTEDFARVLWGDIHGHSQLSDGTGTPEDYFRYARDVASLDFAALTDHDHWGMQFLDQNPALWERIRTATRAFDEPGRFAAILGFEWTSWLHGHRHVLYFDNEGEVLSSLDPRYEDPAQLWAALENRPALTFAHHSAGGPVATNWQFPPDPILEPVTEVTSVHGSSEAPDSPNPIYAAIRGNFVRDVLDVGYRFGFIGSGDGHDGHPGFAILTSGSGSGGLAAVLAEDASRESILAALRARRVYATSGDRIWLDVRVDGQLMGSSLQATADAETQRLDLAVAAPGTIERIEIIRGDANSEIPGGVAHTLLGDAKRDFAASVSFPALGAGEYLYVRVRLESGGAAWSSPFYTHAAGDTPTDSAQSGSQR